ncbi:MAG TPA: zf-HC2 domain-containing protein [Acidobacteriaceae bacterium]|jgi:hypothetical protein|nr:zf-HC2 domain-containing protein [Acidobacteriaceae bacterium]
MAEQNKFGPMPDATRGSGGLRCEEWEALLADALDGLLPATERAAFTAHSEDCVGCADLLAHARQGQEWLEYLHSEPEVPAGLVSRILEKTAGAGAIPVPVLVGAEQGAGTAVAAVPWRRSFQETRLLMTVAMAFFSIALTLNMAGVKLSSVRLADLRPATLGNTLSRQFYGAQRQVVQFYDNMRFVYQLESKMRELRRDAETPQQQQTPTKQAPAKPNGDKDGRLNPGPARGEVLDANHKEQGTGLLARRLERTAECAANSKAEFEVDDLNSLGTHRAGPGRMAESAGNEGRSLA